MTTALGLLLAVRALSVTLDPCLGDSAAELDRMIATEVTDFAEVVPDSQATLHAALSCDGETILIELSDPATGRSSARRVGEGPTGSARDHLLALIVAEMVAAHDAAPASAPVVVEPVVIVRPPARRQAPERWLASVELTSRRFGKPDRLSLGGAVEGELRLHENLWVAGDVELETSTAVVTDGLVGVVLTSASAGPALRARLGQLSACVQAGARAGVVFLEPDIAAPGQANRPASAPWAGAFVGVRADVRVGPVRVGLALEAGAVSKPVVGRVNGYEQVRVDGDWVGGALSVGM